MGFLRVIFGVLLCLNLIIVGCARPVSPGALIDDLGREITLDHYPERIVSLAPSNTEILFALGLGDKVVSVTDMCDYPEEAKSKPELDGFEPSIEFIIGQSPDLVMAIGEYPDLISKMEAQNLTIVALQPQGINGVIKNIELVGKLTGTDKKAKILADDIRKRLQNITNITAGVKSKPKVFYIIGIGLLPGGSLWTAGPGSFIDEMITLSGGTNIAGKTTGAWVEISLEYVISSDPDIIVIAGGSHGISINDVAASVTSWNTLTAVKNNKIYTVDSDLGVRPGPRIIQGFEEMAELIHPELFK